MASASLRMHAALAALWLVACSPSVTDRVAPPAEGVRLLVITDLAGTPEPCGCTPQSSQGGLSRLAVAVRAARETDTPTLLLVAGPTFYEPAARAPVPAQEHWQAEFIADALHAMGADLGLASASDERAAHDGGARLFARAKMLALARARPGGPPSATRRVLGGRTLAIVGGDAPGAPLEMAIARERAAGADFVVALLDASGAAPANPGESSADLTVLAGAPHGAPRVEADAVYAGRQGAFLAVVDVRPGHAASVRLEPVTPDTAPDPALRTAFAALTKRVHAHNAAQLDALDEGAPSGPFAGSRACAACHTAQFLWWRTSPHGRAYATLTTRGREHDLDCVGCHVTGFDIAVGARPEHAGELSAVGCESCHGPGAAHVEDPAVAALPRAVAPTVCAGCHDDEHSPEFAFDAYTAALATSGHGRHAGR